MCKLKVDNSAIKKKAGFALFSLQETRNPRFLLEQKRRKFSLKHLLFSPMKTKTKLKVVGKEFSNRLHATSF